MTHARRVPLAVAIAGVVGACSDDVDLTGTYVVSAHVSSMPCGTDAPVAMPSVTLVFARGDLYGQEYFTYKRCTDEAAMTCTTTGLFGDSFAEQIDGGWLGVLTSSGGGGSTCTIQYARQTAMLSDSALVVEISKYAEQVGTSSACTPEEAERRGTKMPCVEHERIDATKQ